MGIKPGVFVRVDNVAVIKLEDSFETISCGYP